MKMRKIYAAVLAASLTLALALPAYASEATDIPPVTEQEITDPTLPPEETPDTDPAPPETIDPIQPDPGEVVDPDIEVLEEPPVPDDTQAPIDEPVDDPGVEDPSEGPQLPDGVEDPAGAAPGEIPEEPVPPEGMPVIEVEVPASGQVVVNPYCMPVATTYGETTEQIVHEAQALVNYSDFPVQVSAQVVGTLWPESLAYFAPAPPAGNSVDKEIFLYVEFQNDPAMWSGVYGDWPNQILVTDWGMWKENVMRLDALGVGYFRLFGTMTSYPDVMWAEEDTPNVTVAFSFAEAPGVDQAEEPASPEMPPEMLPEVLPETVPEEIPSDVIPEELPEIPAELPPGQIPEPVPDSASDLIPDSDTVPDQVPSAPSEPDSDLTVAPGLETPENTVPGQISDEKGESPYE